MPVDSEPHTLFLVPGRTEGLSRSASAFFFVRLTPCTRANSVTASGAVSRRGSPASAGT
jgi:hypothetical protein